MNKSKIEWTNYTWNPVTGCLHGCEFCYARRIDKRFGDGKFSPIFHPERLADPLRIKKSSRIFVGSMSDLFGDWIWDIKNGVESEQYSRSFVVNEILNVAKLCPQHTFIFLTKNPKGMQDIDFPENCWCGTSAENQEKANQRIPQLLKVNCKTLFTSVEPILGPVKLPWVQHGLLDPDHYRKLDWVIIGAQTGPEAVKPEYSWVNTLVEQCRVADVPLFIKDNAADYYYGELLPRQFPGEGQV